MKSFRHFNANSIEEAVLILDEYKDRARVVAGGTDLLGTLKDQIHFQYPEVLVNLKTIPELSYIKEDDEGLKIGALTKIREIEKHPIVREKYRVLSEAAHAVASPQIRNMGTLSGNICQEPRCWYYRNPENAFHCLRKDGKTCNALTGENRFHSLFGAARVNNPPCASSCPGTVNIPEYLEKIREGDLPRAAQILLLNNPIPAITGRVCPHFCEEECNRVQYDEAVSIRGVERFVGDFILEHATEIIRSSEKETGKRVAVIGSGPAGLAAAFYLRMRGHRVVVFDKMEEAGGMLTYGIPAYRLPKKVVRQQIKVLEKAGVEFRLKTDVGKNVNLETIKEEFDSLFLATGAWRQTSIGLLGEALTKSGLEFLTNINKGIPEVPGEKVVVIGGGNVAVDVGITSKRLGAREVTLACLESRQEMPALEGEIQQALEEGIKLMPGWGPLNILERNGRVRGIELVKCTSVFDDQCRFSPEFDDTVRQTIEADQIILAVGQQSDPSILPSKWNIEVSRGLIQIDEGTQLTGMSGVFAGGDVTSGPATVIQAVAAGRRAAEAIDQSLTGRQGSVSEKGSSLPQPLLNFNQTCLQKTPRTPMKKRATSERSLSKEDRLGFKQNEMEMEADRCFNCGCVAVNASDMATALVALDAKIRTNKRTVEAEAFFASRPFNSTILDADELVEEVRIPGPNAGAEPRYSKFSIRKSIDFPIVGVASVIHVDSGKVQDARIVLGAVAPIPVRVRGVEDFLKGKVISEDIADEAANMAISGAISLEKNEYKLQIAKALIKRAILGAI